LPRALPRYLLPRGLGGQLPRSHRALGRPAVPGRPGRQADPRQTAREGSHARHRRDLLMFQRTLFLHPPSFEGFEACAGSRYQAGRERRSCWHPTWLAQPAALVPGSRLIDAPPDGLTLDDVRPLAKEYELAVLHTSTPSFPHDVKVAEALKAENPQLSIGMV